MDGFRDRMSGRYERNAAAHSDATSRTFERPARSAAPEGASVDAINEIINKSNQEQINVLAEYFDEAKADRMESERAIIEELSCRMNEILSSTVVAASEPVAQEASEIEESAEEENTMQIPVIDPECISRIERIAGQNAEGISENGEMAERSVEYLRAHSEILSEIRSGIETIKEKQDSFEMPAISAAPAPVPVIPELTVDFTEEKEEILSAVGDNRAILNMLRQDVLNAFAKPSGEEETEETESEEQAQPELLTKELGEKHFSALEELVHSECVKVFKNMKKTLEEENVKINAQTQKTVSSLRVFLLASVALNVVSVVILVLQFLGIFS